ncbi:alpha-glucosidase AglA [Pseudothermotoga sp.]|uniref:alpha-glucosidase AglA n=1 Tax=Pseudothermotoga sp. TaxID=2033661 RepID=UPI0031F65405
MKSLKISIVGAGSAVFSMSLVNDLCKLKGFSNSTVVLMDIDVTRLNAVFKLATRYAEETGANLKIEATENLEKALSDCDFVVNTAQVGGSQYIEKVRSLSEKYGYYRGIDAQEFNMVSNYYTISYFNQLKFFVDLAKLMEKLCPRAILLLVSNPVFEGANLISRCSSMKLVGFCHGYRGVFDLAQSLGLDEKKLDWQVAGFNHAIWLNRFFYEGEDGYKLLDRWIEGGNLEVWKPRNPFDVQMSPAAIDMYRFYGVMPIGDTVRNSTWYYNKDFETKKRWYGEPWGGPDSDIGRRWLYDQLALGVELIKKFAQDESFSFKRFVNYFGPLLVTLPKDIRQTVEMLLDANKLSNEPVVQFIDSLVNGNVRRFVINVPNEGYIEGIPDGVFVEVPAVVDRDGWHVEKIEPKLSEKVLKFYLWPRMLRMEWALYAIMNGDKSALIEFLMRDPRTNSLEQAENVIEEILNLPENLSMKKHYEENLKFC